MFRARRLPRGVAAEWLGVATAGGAAALLLPAWAVTGAPAVPAAAWPWVAAQMAAAPLAMLLFFRQQRADAMTMSFIGYAMALCAALLGTLLLGERLPWQLLPAAALIVTGFWWMQRTAPPPAAAPAARG